MYMKKILSTKLSLILLLPILVLSSVSLAFITTTQPVQAADITATECQKDFDGKVVTTKNVNDPRLKAMSGWSDCVSKDYCTIVSAGNKITDYAIKCKDASSVATEDGQSAAASAFASTVCSHTSREMGQAGYTSSDIDKCKKAVTAAYNECSGSGSGSVKSGDQAGGGTNDSVSAVVACLKPKLAPGKIVAAKNLSEAQLTKAVQDARNSGSDAYKDEVDKRKQKECEDGGKTWEDGECVTKEDESSCNIDGIGWIVCPVMSFIGNIVDVTYGVVEDLLTVRSTWSNNDGPLYNAWAMARTFANVCFVIAFMIIIYSQITGAGLNNYGVKKMLPRIVMAVILVNLSYWICAAAVDVSNIVGANVKALFDTTAISLSDDNAYVTSSGDHNGSWAGAIGLAAAATGVLMWTTIGVLAPLAVAALVAIITVLVVLVARQAIIIFLIVLAPLAFVAFLLPNTQKWFDRWKDSFLAMLIMYPLIGLLFGASNLASYILASTAGGQIGAEDSTLQTDSTMVTLQLAALGVAVIPLILTPFILKLSTGVLGKIGGFINNPNRGPIDGLRKRADGYRDHKLESRRGKQFGLAGKVMESDNKALGGKNSRRRKTAAFLAGGKSTRDSVRDQRYGFAKAVADESSQEYLANRALSDPGFAAKQAGGDEKKAISVQASAQSAVDKIIQQDTANRTILYEADVKVRNNPQVELKKALESGDEVGIRALSTMLMKGGSSGYEQVGKTLREYQESNGGQSNTSTEAMRKFIGDNGKDFIGKDPAAVKWAKGAFDTVDEKTGNVTRKATLKEAMEKAGGVSRTDEQLAGITSSAMRAATANGSVSVDQARSMLSNPQIVKATSIDNQDALRALIASSGNIQITGADKAKVVAEGKGGDVDAELKAAVQRIAKTAPTVEQIQNITVNSEAKVSQGEIKIDHSQPATPENLRTSAPTNTSNYQQRPSGLYVPPTAGESPNPPAQPPNSL